MVQGLGVPENLEFDGLQTYIESLPKYDHAEMFFLIDFYQEHVNIQTNKEIISNFQFLFPFVHDNANQNQDTQIILITQ